MLLMVKSIYVRKTSLEVLWVLSMCKYLALEVRNSRTLFSFPVDNNLSCAYLNCYVFGGSLSGIRFALTLDSGVFIFRVE